MNSLPDYYRILGVSRDASREKIRAAYRKLAIRFHPDHNKDACATEKFAEINQANAVLKDPEKRRRYDLQFNAAGAVSLDEVLARADDVLLRMGEMMRAARFSQGRITSRYSFAANPVLEVQVSVEHHATLGGLELKTGRGRQIIFTGEPKPKMHGAVLVAENFHGEIYIPEECDTALSVNVYEGYIKGTVAHNGKIQTENTFIDLALAGNTGAIVRPMQCTPRFFNLVQNQDGLWVQDIYNIIQRIIIINPTLGSVILKSYK